MHEYSHYSPASDLVVLYCNASWRPIKSMGLMSILTLHRSGCLITAHLPHQFAYVHWICPLQEISFSRNFFFEQVLVKLLHIQVLSVDMLICRLWISEVDLSTYRKCYRIRNARILIASEEKKVFVVSIAVNFLIAWKKIVLKTSLKPLFLHL